MTRIVPEELDGERLDRAVAVLGDVSRSLARAMVDDGGVTVDGVPVTEAKARVRAGSVLAFETPETDDRLVAHPVVCSRGSPTRVFPGRSSPALGVKLRVGGNATYFTRRSRVGLMDAGSVRLIC